MLYRAEESDVAGRTVAWCGFIATRGRVERVPRPPPAVVVAAPGVLVVVVLAAEERDVELRAAVRGDIEGSSCPSWGMVEGCGMPVRAVQISAMGGSASGQGTVKRGLSQRLFMEGSS